MFIKKLVVNRPLIFLCGSSIKTVANGNDIDIDPKEKVENKRIILAKYILNEGEKYSDFRPLPLIVDELFSNKDEIRKYKLNIGLLEEIVSNIACKTYIFLDTMSTSYELGLFSNSKQKNNVSILLDNEYNKRINCYVGEYITKSLNDHIINYEARYNASAYIYFKNNEVPKPISDDVNFLFKDNINKTMVGINFTKGIDKNISFGNIRYDIPNSGKINFQVDIKTLFYLIGQILRIKKYSILDFEEISKKDSIDSLYIEIVKVILETFVFTIEDRLLASRIVFENWNFNLFIYEYNTKEIIKNILYIIFSMKSKRLLANDKRITELFEKNYNGEFLYNAKKINQLDVFGLNEFDYHLIRDYLKNQNYFISSFILQMHGKKRRITTYANNQSGKKLKELHNKINTNLSKLPTSSSAYAYKRDMNTLKCVEKHKNSTYFSKYDIKKYFENIKLNIVVKKLIDWQSEKFNKWLDFIGEYNWYGKYLLDTNRYIIKEIVESISYNNSIPIGFITSPKISDFYLYDFDKGITSEDIVYTRYADDILISSDKPISKDVKAKLTENLERLKLKANENKMLEARLINNGDSIKFLGLVIVKKENQNIIKVSNSYIKRVSKLCSKVLLTKDKGKIEILLGEINYIKYVSQSSYQMLDNLVSLKIGKDLNQIIKIINNY